jgi:hypothetical protein
VVRGPLLAMYLAELTRAQSADRVIRGFEFRFTRPAFVGDEIRVLGTPVDGGIDLAGGVGRRRGPRLGYGELRMTGSYPAGRQVLWRSAPAGCPGTNRNERANLIASAVQPQTMIDFGGQVGHELVDGKLCFAPDRRRRLRGSRRGAPGVRQH